MLLFPAVLLTFIPGAIPYCSPNANTEGRQVTSSPFPPSSQGGVLRGCEGLRPPRGEGVVGGHLWHRGPGPPGGAAAHHGDGQRYRARSSLRGQGERTEASSSSSSSLSSLHHTFTFGVSAELKAEAEVLDVRPPLVMVTFGLLEAGWRGRFSPEVSDWWIWRGVEPPCLNRIFLW